jgi:hypothetical protein
MFATEQSMITTVAVPRTLYVSRVVNLTDADAAAALRSLVGQSIGSDGARLVLAEVDRRTPSRGGSYTSRTSRIRGVLYTGGLIPRFERVEVELTPWSDERSELGLLAVSRLPLGGSVRTERYLEAANLALDDLAAEVVKRAEDQSASAERNAA